jgi:hypothetical protein
MSKRTCDVDEYFAVRDGGLSLSHVANAGPDVSPRGSDGSPDDFLRLWCNREPKGSWVSS